MDTPSQNLENTALLAEINAPEIREALKNERLAALLIKYKSARARKDELKELRALLGGPLPHEKDGGEPSLDSPAPAPVKAAPKPLLAPIPSYAVSLGDLARGPGELFQAASQRLSWSRLQQTLEYDIAQRAAASAFFERPTLSVWEWADENVFLTEIMTSEPGPYRSIQTPWTRTIQELPLDPTTRVAVFMKPSRSGVSEAALNILRYMPNHWPGNAGFVYPDDKQARDVANRRVIDSLKEAAGAKATQDPNDSTLSFVKLANMMVRFGGSGSAKMFTEIYFRYITLDEYEEHQTNDTTTTLDRALSRQADVADALCLVISKPKVSGGPIDAAWVKGTQEEWLVPCPHCKQLIELKREFFHDEHCRDEKGNYNLSRVLHETWYQCQECGERINESSKAWMRENGQFVPRPEHLRRKDKDGKVVPVTPGWRSFHVSDYLSYHPTLTWGALRVMYLTAFEINPDLKQQAHFVNNHEGWPFEYEVSAVDSTTLTALVAGRVESREITLPDGSKVTQTQTIGIPGGYSLAYLNGVPQAPLPIEPMTLVCFCDKQKTLLKYLVFAVCRKGDLYLIDMGRVEDENQLYHQVLKRDYFFVDKPEPLQIASGYIDSRYLPMDVFNMCHDAITHLGKNFYPIRGEGDYEVYKGKVIRTIKDHCDRGPIIVRYFKDAVLKTIFYHQKLVARKGWRYWLPVNYPPALAAEWGAERWDQNEEKWIHDERKHGPNDYGDCGKMGVLWMIENRVKFLQRFNPEQLALELLETPIETEAPIENESPPAPKGRDYVLHIPVKP